MIIIKSINDTQKDAWDAYILGHAKASVYHLYAFKQAVEKTYGHKSYYFAAYNDSDNRIIGILPLFQVSSILLGSSLVSIPFCDYGGILFDDEKTGQLLYEKALSLQSELNAKVLELRHTFPLSFDLLNKDQTELVDAKVRMKLALPATNEALFSSFPAKLRSQVRKPQKEGCIAKSGGVELLDDFYKVFVYNMRDLGSPVHPKNMMRNILLAYGNQSQLFVVYKADLPIACSLTVALNKALVNPWASFNKNYRACAPNMLLYWTMMDYAIGRGFTTFDFGRSTKDEGTYRFKEQWGALPEPLFWYYHYRDKKPSIAVSDGKNKKRFIAVWQKLPLGLTSAIGPIIRKQIPL